MGHLRESQRAICAEYGAVLEEVFDQQMIGVAQNFDPATYPINGLRHPPRGDTSGWYIWSGEKLSSDPEFFTPMHIAHLPDMCPGVLKFLGLPAGWRFLLAPDYEDVWYDSSLLLVD